MNLVVPLDLALGLRTSRSQIHEASRKSGEATRIELRSPRVDHIRTES